MREAPERALTLRRVGKLAGHGKAVCDLAWSPAGTILASASRDRTVRLWNAQRGLLRSSRATHDSYVNCVAWDADGKRLASGSRDQTVRIWDDDGGEVARLPHGNSVEAIAWSSEGARIVSGTKAGNWHLWDAATGQLLHRHPGHDGRIADVAFVDEGGCFVSGAVDGAVCLWEARDVKPVWRREFESAVTSIAVVREPARILTALDDGRVVMLDAATGKQELEDKQPASAARVIRVSGNGSLVAVQRDEGVTTICETASWSLVATIKSSKSRRGIRGLAFHPDGRVLASLIETNRSIVLSQLVPAGESEATEAPTGPSRAGRNRSPQKEALKTHGGIYIHKAFFGRASNVEETNIQAEGGAQVNYKSQLDDVRVISDHSRHQTTGHNLDAALNALADVLRDARDEYREEVREVEQRLEELNRQLATAAESRKPGLLKLAARHLVDVAKAVGSTVPGLVDSAEKVWMLIRREG